MFYFLFAQICFFMLRHDSISAAAAIHVMVSPLLAPW